MDPNFVMAAVYLSAALLVVPLAVRFGLGSVLGYLLAGLLIGPFALDLVGDHGKEVMHFAEFGVVMMLFLVGLELEPERLWRLRNPILGLGGLQVAVTTAVVAAGGLAFGLPWQQALAVGLAIALSSTAIAVQSLGERGLLSRDSGQRAFSVLLFQDIAVIPILAGLPLLVNVALTAHDDGHHAPHTLVEGLSGPVHALVVLLSVAGVALGARFLVRPALRAVARSHMRELFTAASLLLVVGVTLLMMAVGLSPALGTFLAGVVLANSEYRHELESDIEPFKGLLLGLFFMSVGASLDLALVAADPVTALGLVVGLVAVKLAVLALLGAGFGLRGAALAQFTVSLGQIGEFAFVVLAFAATIGVVPSELALLLGAATALSMALSPVLITATDRVIALRAPKQAAAAVDEAGPTDDGHAVIIAGYGRFGQIAGRFLRASGVGATVLDVDPDQLDVLRKFGHEVHYGDASRVDLLHAAGAHRAKVLVVAVDDPQKALQITEVANKHFPHLAILARARGRTEAYDLLEHEVAGVYRETFDTALRAGVDALRLLGVHAHRAQRLAHVFREHDDESVRKLAPHRADREQLMRTAKERVRELERALRADEADAGALDDDGWDDTERREAAR